MKPLHIAATIALCAGTAAQAQEVNVYSYRQPELIQPLMDAFTDETGIDVNVAFLNKGMVERLVAEGRRSPADLILTTDVAHLAQAVEAGVTQALESDLLEARLPETLRDAQGHWFALTTRARIVYASKERVAEGEVTTYEELADPKWQGRICTRSGTHSYMLALTAAMILHHGEEATTLWLEGVKANLARKPQGNDRAQVKAIAAGECDISLGNTYYMGAMLADPDQVAWADAVRLDFPVFEGAGTHVNISGIALTKAAPNRDNAVKLIEFLTAPKAQEIYAEVVYEYPASIEAKTSDLVASWGSFTGDTLNLMELANMRARALILTQQADYDG